MNVRGKDDRVKRKGRREGRREGGKEGIFQGENSIILFREVVIIRCGLVLEVTLFS
jgi:hypothetical protein